MIFIVVHGLSPQKNYLLSKKISPLDFKEVLFNMSYRKS